MPHKVEELERLGSLLDQGKLTSGEYERLKLEILESGVQGADSPRGSTSAAMVGLGGQPEDGAAPTPASPYAAIQTLDGVASILAIALWANAAYWALEASIGFDLAFTPIFWGTSGAADWIGTLEELYPWALITTGVLFVVWSYRAHTNLRMLGRTGQRHQSHETVWWWVVPIANLVMPFKVIYEIVRGVVAPLNDQDWRTHTVSPLLPWWVGLFVGGVLVTGYARGLVNTASTIDAWTTGATLYTLGSSALAAAAVLAAKLTNVTTRRQARQIGRVAGRGGIQVTTGERAEADDDSYIRELARGEYWKTY